MKVNVRKKIAIVLCIIFVFTTMQFYSGEFMFAKNSPWAEELAKMLTDSKFRTARDLYTQFSALYPIEVDWLIQDCEKLKMKPVDIFSADSAKVYKLAKSVDDSVQESDSIENMIYKYARAVETRSKNRLTNLIENVSNQFIVVKHKQLGGSHYAYTEAVSDDRSGSPEGNEFNFHPGSEMVLLTLKVTDNKVERIEEVLLSSDKGVIRDPDVSEDGTKVLYSFKENIADDFHLYEMDLQTREIRQLTNDPGVADIEPKYLNDGRIVFSSTRTIQNVDCWKTPVSNLFICDKDGNNIVRVGYDQVHTTYPTITSDGRVLYTRWDYNDRTQMWVQGIFQMFTDGTNQTELFANDMDFPTTLVHTMEIPGTTGQYYSIATGHHTLQVGKLCKIDLSKGRDSKDAVEFVFPDRYTVKNDGIDAYGQQGALYKYPYPISDGEFLVSCALSGYAHNHRETPFNIYYMNANGDREILSLAKDGIIGASQIVPVKKRVLFERPDLTDYSKDTGYFYLGNVYEGKGMEGVKHGEAKYLRIVALDYRTSAIGANQGRGSGTSDPYTPVSAGNGTWDVKMVLGIVPIYEDGSALFEVPANLPVYFQVLNENGEMIQSMRSWSTLMPNETFSCVGCHEDKNTVPPMEARVTMAMKAGPSKIQPDFWQTGEGYEDYDPYKDYKGFSYLQEIQPILDKNCVSCHNNRSLTLLGTTNINLSDHKLLLERRSDWKYTTDNVSADWYKPEFNDSGWKTGKAPFGTEGTPPGGSVTNWSNNKIYLRKEINLTAEQANAKDFVLDISYDENPTIYVNGELVFKETGYTPDYVKKNMTLAMKKALKPGKNVIAVSAENTGGGQFIDLAIYYSANAESNANDSPVSLESVEVKANREKRRYPLSYLVLTDSDWNGVGVQFLANSTNRYTNWISGMSRATMVKPYEFGSTKSNLIKRLREGHGNLTDVEIRKFAAWNDLGVPLCGTYDEQAAWSSHDLREYEEKGNKRAYYVMANEMAMRALANGGVYPDSRELKIEYYRKNQLVSETTGSGLVRLVLDKSYLDGDKIKITLPEGEKYLYFNLDTRVKEALIYVPDGVFEYEISYDILKNMPDTLAPNKALTYIKPMISARLPLKEDLMKDKNLALNPYDTDNNDKAFPHVTAGNTYNNGNSPEFNPRNAIDGFANNLGHGNYPVQSWGPDNNVKLSDMWLNVDFGREVILNKVAITIRADFPHDTYIREAVLEFSDGTTKNISLKRTQETQIIELDEIKTSSIRIKDIKKGSNTWVAITEFEAYGHEVQ